MDKALSFANGIRIGEAWLRESKRNDRGTEHANAAEAPGSSVIPESIAAPQPDVLPEFAAAPEFVAAPPFAMASEVAPASAPVVAPGATSLENAAESATTAESAEPFTSANQSVFLAGQAGASTDRFHRVPAAESAAVFTPSKQRPAAVVRSSGETVSPVPEATPPLTAMRGITVGTLHGVPAGSPQPEVHRTLAHQAVAGVLCVLALTPPVVASLLLGLSHRAHLIPFAPVWAWMAALLALGATVRSTISASDNATQSAADPSGKGNWTGHAPVPWLAPVLLGVLLLVPAAVVLYLRLTLTPVPLRLAIAQVALYALCLVALLLSSPRTQPN